MIDQQIDIPTRDGQTTTFITRPERGAPGKTRAELYFGSAERQRLPALYRRNLI